MRLSYFLNKVCFCLKAYKPCFSTRFPQQTNILLSSKSHPQVILPFSSLLGALRDAAIKPSIQTWKISTYLVIQGLSFSHHVSIPQTSSLKTVPSDLHFTGIQEIVTSLASFKRIHHNFSSLQLSLIFPQNPSFLIRPNSIPGGHLQPFF